MKKLVLLAAALITTAALFGCAEEYVRGGINDDGLYENPVAGFTYEFPLSVTMMDVHDLKYKLEAETQCDFYFVTEEGNEVMLLAQKTPVSAYPADILAEEIIEDIEYDLENTTTVIEYVSDVEHVEYGGAKFERLDIVLGDKDRSIEDEEVYIIYLFKSAGDRMMTFVFVGDDNDEFEDLADGFDEYIVEEEEDYR